MTTTLNSLLVSFSSVTQLCPTVCDPMDYSMPGFPDHHQLPELAQNHVHGVSDAIQPSHPLLSLAMAIPRKMSLFIPVSLSSFS